MSPLDILDDVSLEMSRTQRAHLDLIEALRTSLELEPMSEAPRSGICFTAYLSNGKRVTCERFDDAFVCGTTGAPRRPIPASEFVGWLPGSEDAAYEAPEPYVLSEDQERAEYRAEEIDLDRSMGRED